MTKPALPALCKKWEWKPASWIVLSKVGEGCDKSPASLLVKPTLIIITESFKRPVSIHIFISLPTFIYESIPNKQSQMHQDLSILIIICGNTKEIAEIPMEAASENMRSGHGWGHSSLRRVIKIPWSQKSLITFNVVQNCKGKDIHAEGLVDLSVCSGHKMSQTFGPWKKCRKSAPSSDVSIWFWNM